MDKNFAELLHKAEKTDKIKVAVVNPVDENSLLGAIEAGMIGLIDPILIGDKDKIIKLAEEIKEDISSYEIIDKKTEEDVLKTMVDLSNENKIQSIMKGKIHTDHLLKEIFKKENNFRTGKQINHLFAVAVPSYHKIIYITDCAINISPTMQQKVKILENSVDFLNKIGVKMPKVGVLSAVETVNPTILSSVDAHYVANNHTVQGRAIVEGPLAFDNIISKTAADIKGIKSEVAGDVDLIIAPDLNTGNVLVKELVYLANAEVAGFVLGARLPIILTSRADSPQARLMSCVLAKLSV